MSLVTLRLFEPAGRRHVIDGHSVTVRRLKGSTVLGQFSPTVIRDCVIDTGAYLTVVPKSVWQPLMQNDVHWLTREADPLLPEWLRGVMGIGGRTYNTRLGILSMRLLGGLGEALPWTKVAAHFVC